MVDRFYYDNRLNRIGVIQYITPSGLKRIYPIPFYDTYKILLIKKKEAKIIFPWCRWSDV